LIPYTLPNAGGTQGTDLRQTFLIVDQAPQPSPSPSASPSPTPTPLPSPTPPPTPTATPTPTPTPVSYSYASFVQLDTTTQGNWKSAYGADGYNSVNDSVN